MPYDERKGIEGQIGIGFVYCIDEGNAHRDSFVRTAEKPHHPQFGTVRKENFQEQPGDDHDQAQEAALNRDHDDRVHAGRLGLFQKRVAKHRVDDEDQRPLLSLFETRLIFRDEAGHGRHEILEELADDDGRNDPEAQLHEHLFDVDRALLSQVHKYEKGGDEDPQHVSERGVEDGRGLVPPGGLGHDQDHVDRHGETGADDHPVGQIAGEDPRRREQARDAEHYRGHPEEVERLDGEVEPELLDRVGELLRLQTQARHDEDEDDGDPLGRDLGGQIHGS
mmetsp:Transcript_43374/g.101764  ORF Transcript_43374/g.101764 Transcript_43374/m.101764 type:complete len:280 (+) Transcript_43374:166-1005(+)